MIPNACFKTDRPIQCHHPPAPTGQVRSGQGGGDGDEHSRRQSSVQVRMFPESPACILKQNKQDRHVLSLCCVIVSACDLISAYRCWHGSLLHIACPWLSVMLGSVNKSGESTGDNLWKRGGGRPISFCSQAPRQHEVSGSPTPSATWDTGGPSHTQSGMWCSCLECMFHGMLRWSLTSWGWKVVSWVLYPLSHGWPFDIFAQVLMTCVLNWTSWTWYVFK